VFEPLLRAGTAADLASAGVASDAAAQAAVLPLCWAPALVLQAQGRYEDATAVYEVRRSIPLRH
jgi:hypothetical protein